jgi:hypothetical protein
MTPEKGFLNSEVHQSNCAKNTTKTLSTARDLVSLG